MIKDIFIGMDSDSIDYAPILEAFEAEKARIRAETIEECAKELRRLQAKWQRVVNGDCTAIGGATSAAAVGALDEALNAIRALLPPPAGREQGMEKLEAILRRRELIYRNVPLCPACDTKQVQIIDITAPARWKCRKCKHLFTAEPRAEAAEAEVARIRAETIEECAKVADAKRLGEDSMLANTRTWAVHEGACIEIAEDIRALEGGSNAG